jgi:signal transduction histidine kinase
MAKLPLNRSLILLLVGFAVLAASVFATLWLGQRQQRAYAEVNHTLEVDNLLWTVLSRLQDAETGQRGYLLTGQPAFLAPYKDSIEKFDGDFAALAIATSDNPEQTEALGRLRPLTDERRSLLRDVISDYQRGLPIHPDRLIRGKELMDQIRRIIAEMEAEQRSQLHIHAASASRMASLVFATLIISAIATLILGVFSLRHLSRRLAEAVRTRNSLSLANAQLEAEAANREAAERQLRQVQKMESIGQLTGGIAHDFNNMLSIIVGALELAKRRLASSEDDRIQKLIETAMEGAQRAALLTARLLAFSRQQALSPEPLDVNNLVGGMSELLRRALEEQVRIETVLAGGLWQALIDAAQLEQSLLNLCVNARDALPDGGKLTIETSNASLDDAYAAAHPEVTAGQYVLVSVTDNGTGMAPDVVSRAFEPFFTTKGVGKGTGLGLSQVYGFVRQSQGHVKIYSEPGHGTAVKLYLPRFYGETSDRTTAWKKLDREELPHAKANEVVLVVEDEERVRHVTVDALRELGYTVVQAADASQAIAILAVQPRVDLLFTDIVMPVTSGRKLADEVRQDRPDLKVLYTTGYTRNAIVHHGILDHDVALLAKPFTIAQLSFKVRQVLDGT